MKQKITVILPLLLVLSGCNRNTNSTNEPQNYACRIIDTFNYNDAVPASEPIGNEYYEKTLFAGDSRIGAMHFYTGHRNAEIAYVTSLNIFKIDHMPVDERKDKQTLTEILKQTNKENIYLLIGINNIQMTNFDEFGKKYQSLIDSILEKNPNINIYLMSSYRPYKVYGLEESKLPEHLALQNGEIKKLAQNNRIFYLDLDEALAQEDGRVNKDFVSDGLHLNATGTHKLEEYISTHVVRREKYVKEICE